MINKIHYTKNQIYTKFVQGSSKAEKSFYCTVNILIILIVEMLRENGRILLDYKSECNVTKHCLNRACILLF